MSAIFFLLRLPFFVIGLALYVGLATPLGAGFWLLWGSWLVFILPFQFVGKLFSAAFENDSRVLSNWRNQQEAWSAWAGAVGDYFSGYRSLFDWLIHGSK